MMVDSIKTATNLDAHMYELNKEKLRSVYNLPSKKKRTYEVIEHKVIYAKEDNKIFRTKDDNEKTYYSNYKYFREFLTSGFESEETKQEIQEIKKLIENSKNLRENLTRHFQLQGDNENNPNDSVTHSNASSILVKSKFYNNLVKLCNLFKLKSNENNQERTPVFKIYSELNKPSDVYSFSLNENFISNRLLNIKRQLTKSYYQEEFLISFAKNYYTGGSSSSPMNMQIPQTTSESIPQEIRRKLPVDYIDSIFRPRENESFYQIDEFMSIYSKIPKAYLHEKDLYENIYGILSKCNYANFMSYLYSKNNLFKYIYDEFAQKKGTLPESLENVNLSRIDSIETTERFFRGSENLISPKNKAGNLNRKLTMTKSRENNNLDEYLANYYLDKICFLGDKLDEKNVDMFTKENSWGGQINSQILRDSILENIRKLISKDFSHILLISRHEKLKIMYYSEDIETLYVNNSNKVNQDIEEDIKKIQIYKIDYKSLSDKFQGIYGSNSKENEIKEIFSTVSCIYLMEAKKNNQAKDNVSTYHLFRIANDNIDRFEMAVNHLKLLTKFEDKFVNSLNGPNDSFSSTNIQQFNSPENLNIPFVKSMNDKDSPSSTNYVYDDKKISKNDVNILNTKNSKHRISQYDEDFLKVTDSEIIIGALRNKHLNEGNIINSKSLKQDKKENSLGDFNKYDDEDIHNNDFRNLIDKEQQKKSDKEFSPITSKKKPKRSVTKIEKISDNLDLNAEEEIKFKESYMFKIKDSYCKFFFRENKGLEELVYCKFSDDEENSLNRKIGYLLSGFSNYAVAINESKENYKAHIQLRFNNSSKDPFEIVSYDKNDFIKFIQKLDKYVKKV